MQLRLKLISEICPKVGALDGKIEQNHLKMPLCHLFFFFSKKSLHLLKNEKHLSIFYFKNKCTYKSYVFMIIDDFGNMLDSCEFRFGNNLK